MFLLIIRLIYSALEQNDIRVAIVNLLKLYSRDNNLKTVLNSENVSAVELDQPFSVFNPNIIKKLLSILKPSELDELQKQLDNIDSLSNKLNNNQKANQNKDNYTEDAKGWTNLNSSWFKKGTFYITNKSLELGMLQGLFQSDNSKNKRWYGVYTYPGVSKEIWIMMTKAVGKNGTGAGSVFWKYFLRRFLPSKIRKYVKRELQKKLYITEGKQRYYTISTKNVNVLKTTAFINRLERGFFKLKEYKSLPKKEISSGAFRKSRKQELTLMKKYNKYRRI